MEDESVAGGESASENVVADAPAEQVEAGAAEVAQEAPSEDHTEDAHEAAPVSAAVVTPQFSREGVLLNPEDCEISPDGVVRPKAR